MKALEDVAVTKSRWYVGKTAEKWTLVCADVLALAVSFYLAAASRLLISDNTLDLAFRAWGSSLNHVGVYLLLSVFIIGTFWLKGHYVKRRPYWNEIREILKTVFIVALIDSALLLFANWPFSRTTLLLNWILVPCLLVLMRGTAKRLLIHLGGWNRPMVIVGWGDNLIETARAFDDEPLMGYQAIAFLIPEGKTKPITNYKDHNDRSIPCLSLSHSPKRIQQMLDHLGDPHVVLALEKGGIEKYQDTIQCLSHLCQEMQIVPSLRGLPLHGMEVNHFFSHEVLLLTVRNNLARRGPRLIKRCFDIVASSIGLLIISPFLLWIAIKVSSSGGPIFYGHKRVGQNGKSFSCYKFRTMMPNAAQLLQELLERDPEAKAEWERDFKLKNDPRITPIGNFLRKTSLDELPQLWNVLKGEMSLVGPRPIVDAELERYGNQVDHYLKAKPGITGLWQISGRNDITYDTRVYLDAWYVKNWSLFNDIVILLRTVKVILKRDGAY